MFTLEQAYDVLVVEYEKRGVTPTVAEFMEALGCKSTRTAYRYLQRLEAEGWIKRFSGGRYALRQ